MHSAASSAGANSASATGSTRRGRGTGTVRHIVVGQPLEEPRPRLLPHLARLGADATQPNLAHPFAVYVAYIDVHTALGTHGLAAILADDALRPQQPKGIAAEPATVRATFDCVQLDLLDTLHKATHTLSFGNLDLLIATYHGYDGLLFLWPQGFIGL